MLDTRALADLVRPGTTVAFADGVGAPAAAFGPLSDIARNLDGVRLILGWVPQPPDGLDPSAFDDIATVMAGYGLRRLVDTGMVRYLPCRLALVPTLLHAVLLPDVLVASVARDHTGALRFTTEVSWMRAAIAAGATVAAIERPAVPSSDAGPPLPNDQVVMIGEDSSALMHASFGEPRDVHRAVAERVAALIPEEAKLQYAPGAIGAAVIDAVQRPVAIDTGLLTEPVVDLDGRGLLLGTPVAPYLSGERTASWGHGRGMLQPIETTHDQARLMRGRPFVAVNTALEIDHDGQVNVESVDGSAVAGIGGQPDYAAAAAGSVGGLSIMAMPSSFGGRSTLVDRLSAPASTASHDIDVVVTERGSADLRGRDRTERRQLIESLWA